MRIWVDKCTPSVLSAVEPIFINAPMNVVLLRVGIDTGCGGIHSPLFRDGTFEFVPIPDSRGLDERTYGNSKGRLGRTFVEYFSKRNQVHASLQSMHVDPEFESFTYGDPTPPK